MKKIVYLSGGVGGAKFAKGLNKIKNIDLSIIVNTGDDEYIHGVALSPDIDSVIYGLANVEGKYGWGISNDKFSVHNELKKFYDLNFMLGDKDLALNLFRNQMISEGLKLSEITDMIKNKLANIEHFIRYEWICFSLSTKRRHWSMAWNKLYIIT